MTSARKLMDQSQSHCKLTQRIECYIGIAGQAPTAQSNTAGHTPRTSRRSAIARVAQS